jgi:hypothetical protein
MLHTSSATATCRSALNAVQMLRRNKGSTSVHCWPGWHMMAAFSISAGTVPLVHWPRGGGQLSVRAEFRTVWPESVAAAQTESLVGGDGLQELK